MSQAVGALSTTGVEANNTLAEKIQAAIPKAQLEPDQNLANKITR
jgi:hypothetical protein